MFALINANGMVGGLVEAETNICAEMRCVPVPNGVTPQVEWLATENNDGTWSFAAPPTPPPQTIFPSRQLMETLFTPAEQQAIFTAAQTPAGWQVLKFIAFTAATPMVDITAAEFIADIGAVEAAGLLTAPRAAQVLAGTLAPTS